MRTESFTKPKQVKIFKRTNGKCEINIATNITELKGKDSFHYRYDLYRFTWDNYYDNLEKDIKNDFSTWVSYAKIMEGIPEEPSDSEKIAILSHEIQNLKKENQKLWKVNKQIMDIIHCLNICKK